MSKLYTIHAAQIRKTGLALLLLIVLIAAGSCRAPQLMQTEFDGHLLKANESEYVGKPLKTLLKQIKPPIKMVSATGERGHGEPGYFVFLFHDVEAQAAWRKVDRLSPRLTVFVKESFDWNRDSISIQERMQWTQKDLKKYGNLTIHYFRFSGKPL